MAVTREELDRMPMTQVAVLYRGLKCLSDTATPNDYFLDDDGNVTLEWKVDIFAVTAKITQGGVPSTNVATLGRIEDLPLVAKLMRFNQMLISAFELGRLPD